MDRPTGPLDPPPAGAGIVQDTGDGSVDVYLLGFRNDLARARVLAALETGDEWSRRACAMPRDAQFPLRLCTGVPAALAEKMRAGIEPLGAHVAVRPAGSDARAPRIEPRPPRSRSLTWIALVILLGAGLAGHFRWHRVSTVSDRFPGSPLNPVLMEDTEIQDDTAVERLNRDAVALSRAGRHAEAVAKLRQALASAPMHGVVRRNLQVTLTNVAAHELQEGRPAAAIDAFQEALGFGRHPETLAGLGIAYLRARDYRSAQTYLTEADDTGGTAVVVLPALAEVHERRNDRVRALDVLRRARDAGLPLPDLDARIERLARQVDAESEFRTDETAHFQIRFADRESPYAARLVLRSLEAAYEVVGRKFGAFQQQRTQVVLYPDQDFHDITQTPQWVHAAFDGQINLPVRGLTEAGDHTALDRTTRHEYAHSLIAATTGGQVPAWLNEGLAMWAEEELPGDRVGWARHSVTGRRLLTFTEMTASLTTLPEDRIETAYAQSYLSVWYLIDRHGAQRIPQLLAAIAGGRSVDAAFAHVYARDLATLEQMIRDALAG